jgi:hypothetical protein
MGGRRAGREGGGGSESGTHENLGKHVSAGPRARAHCLGRQQTSVSHSRSLSLSLFAHPPSKVGRPRVGLGGAYCVDHRLESAAAATFFPFFPFLLPLLRSNPPSAPARDPSPSSSSSSPGCRASGAGSLASERRARIFLSGPDSSAARRTDAARRGSGTARRGSGVSLTRDGGGSEGLEDASARACTYMRDHVVRPCARRFPTGAVCLPLALTCVFMLLMQLPVRGGPRPGSRRTSRRRDSPVADVEHGYGRGGVQLGLFVLENVSSAHRPQPR